MASDRYLTLDAAIIAKEIDALYAAFPELAEDEALRADMVEGETEFAAVMSRVLDHEREAQAMVEAQKKRGADLAERRGRYERRAEAMRSLMLNLMSVADLQKIALPEATISLSKGREAVEITDIDALPQGFYALERKADKTAIGTALKAGNDVPGAMLAEGNPVLTVRTK